MGGSLAPRAGELFQNTAPSRLTTAPAASLPPSAPQVLLDHVSGKITRGLYAVMGPSGSGKVRERRRGRAA